MTVLGTAVMIIQHNSIHVY